MSEPYPMMPSLYEGDVRRCRRCKRRRMDDEPPEVQQYKTCAKCRIIERTKKKSRKPLAEETMRYGMRQFQEQNQNSNFIHDDIFSNDQLMSEMQAAAAAAAAHDASLMGGVNSQPKQQQQNQQQYSPQQYAALYKQQQQQPQAPQYAGIPSGPGSLVPGHQPDAASYSYLYANSGNTGANIGGAAGGVNGPYAPGPGSAQRPQSAVSAHSPSFSSQQLTQQVTQALAGATAGVSSHGGSVGSPAGQYATSAAAPTSSATAAAIAAAAIKRNDPSLGPSQTLNRSQNHYRQYQQKQQGGDRTRLSAATNCELCNDNLDADDSMSAMYRLCRNCYSDPYARPNVYSDFNDFLLAVVRDKDAESVTYISELASYLVESLSNNRAINSEEQFRKIMMDSFSSIYVDPLVGSLSPLSFTRSSNNVHEVNNTSPIISKVSQQYHYTLTPPLRINYVSESEQGSTAIQMTFITETNLIIMKKTTKKAPQAYDVAFLKSLDEQMRVKGFTFDDDPAKLHEHLNLAIPKDRFVNDFKSLQKQVFNLRTTEAEISQNLAPVEAEAETEAESQAPVEIQAQTDVQTESVAKPELALEAEKNVEEDSEPKPEKSLEPEPQQPVVNGDATTADSAESEPQQPEQKHEKELVVEENGGVTDGEAKTEDATKSEDAVNGKPAESEEGKPESPKVEKETQETAELDPAFAS